MNTQGSKLIQSNEAIGLIGNSFLCYDCISQVSIIGVSFFSSGKTHTGKTDHLNPFEGMYSS